jgi:uncharacterized protein involved in exopolysaccharide biosynthesis
MTDALKLAEVKRLHAAANGHKLRVKPGTGHIEIGSSVPGYVGVCVWESDAKSFAALHNAFPGLLARLDQLQAQLETASNNARHYADRCTALEAEVERLQERADRSGRALADVYSHLTTATARAEAAEKNYEQLTQLCKATEDRERTALTTVAGLRRALEEIDGDVAGLGWTKTGRTRGRISAALAASPDDHARRLKSEALREVAGSYRAYLISMLQTSECDEAFTRGQIAAMDKLATEAVRLEAPNATR